MSDRNNSRGHCENATSAKPKNRNKAYSTKEWIKLAMEKNSSLDYSKVEYVDKNTKVIIGCPKHGEFLVNPKYFLWSKPECPFCAKDSYNENKKESFIIKAKKVHKDKYDYSKVIYNGIDEKVCIICPKHGDFIQKINNHLMGAGCPKCGNEAIGNTKRMTKEEFVRKSRELYGWKFDYSKVEYKGTEKKVCIICPKHGEFWQTPHSHLAKNGCHKCNMEEEGYGRRLTLDEFKKKAQEVHGNMYDYSKVKYINSGEKVCIICSKHGEFWQTPVCHIYSHQGCPKCKIPRLEKDVMKILDGMKINYIWQYHNREILGRQSFDFYLPEFNLAIECQGIQHFQKVNYRVKNLTEKDIEECFVLNQKRDKSKKEICKKNSIRLVYYLSKDFVKKLESNDEFATNKEELVRLINDTMSSKREN